MTWVLVIVVVLLVVVGLVLHRRRSAHPVEPCYELRPLGENTRKRFAEQWKVTQAKFVDQPAAALTDARALLGEVMRERGYPADAAHALGADASTPAPRRAMARYGALFAELLEPTHGDGFTECDGARMAYCPDHA